MEVDCWRKILGVPVPHPKAVLIPGVGCRRRCAFCCTSHFFDGYGAFFRGADELFAAMERISRTLGTKQFFVLDENFLDDRERIAGLLALMESHDRRFELDIFASLQAASRYDPLELVKLGVRFIWVGVESRKELFEKVKGVDAARVIGELRRHGISVLASTILFLDHHDRVALQEDVDYTIGLEADFVQFMELSPLPGTGTFEKLVAEGRILTEVPYREWHGQDRIWFTHPHFAREETKPLLDAAFEQDFQRLGPSLLRVADTRIRALDLTIPAGDRLLAARQAELRDAAVEMRPLLPALIRLAPNEAVRERARRIEARYLQHLGPWSLGERAAAVAVSVLASVEGWRQGAGRAAHQPPSFVDRYRQ